MKGKKEIQGAKTVKLGGSADYGAGSKVKGPDATSFSARSGRAAGTTGGKTGRGAQYDSANVGFNHGYDEAAAQRIVNALHKK